MLCGPGQAATAGSPVLLLGCHCCLQLSHELNALGHLLVNLQGQRQSQRQ